MISSLPDSRDGSPSITYSLPIIAPSSCLSLHANRIQPPAVCSARFLSTSFCRPDFIYRASISSHVAARITVCERPLVDKNIDASNAARAIAAWLNESANTPAVSTFYFSSHQRAVNPPSTIRLCPVTKDALPEHNQRTASATSSTRPIRPIG